MINKHLHSSPYHPSENRQSKQKKPAPSSLDPATYEKILTEELEKARSLLESLGNGAVDPRDPANELIHVERLRQIEGSIDMKNKIIKQLEQQIIMLKNRYKDINEPIQNKITNIMISIKQNTNVINQLITKIKLCKTNNMNIVTNINQIYQKYINKCSQININVIEYNKFQINLNEKQKQSQQKMYKGQDNYHKKKLSSIYQNNYSNKKYEIQPKKTFASQSKTINQSLSRRNVAQTALKNQRKKHRKQIANLMSKLEFLKDQDNDLDIKIQSKLIQLQNAEKKFTERYNSNLSVNKSNNNKSNNNSNSNHNINIRSNDNSNRKITKFKTIN